MIGVNIYQYVKDRHIVNYGSYPIIIFRYRNFGKLNAGKLKAGIPFTGRSCAPFGHAIKARIEIILPTDINVDKFAQLTIMALNDLLRMQDSYEYVLSPNVPVRVDIGPKFGQGLGIYA